MNLYIIIITSIIFSALFSGLEIAFISSNKLLIELDKKKGHLSGKILSYFNQDTSSFIATMLVGNNISLVVYGTMMTNLLTPLLILYLPPQLHSDGVLLIIQTILSTLIILVTAEFLPKVIFKINPNYVLSIFAVPAIVLYFLLYPFVIISKKIAEFIISKIFKVQISSQNNAIGYADLNNYLKEYTNEQKEENNLKHDIQIFQNVIDFRTVKIRECMIPRTEIIALDINSAIDELHQEFVDTGLSKILIYENSIDNIIGYTHSHDLFNKPEKIKEILRAIIFVPETMQANEVLTVFIQQHRSIAVVVDEFGGTSGIVTIEDVMEEIFGEINDEFDTDDLIERQINDNEYIFSGRLEIDYINEKYHLQLPDSEDYETIGGLIFHHHQSIPNVGEEIIIENFVFSITHKTDTRIEQIHLRLKK